MLANTRKMMMRGQARAQQARTARGIEGALDGGGEAGGRKPFAGKACMVRTAPQARPRRPRRRQAVLGGARQAAHPGRTPPAEAR